jgi:hypothetical protein
VVSGPVARPPALGGMDPWLIRTRSAIPILIALTSVLGAVGAWRASAAGTEAANAGRKAFADTVAAEQQRVTIDSILGSIEIAYTEKASLVAMADSLRERAGQASGEEGDRLLALADAYQSTADGFFIDADALRPDGSLDLEAKSQIEWALAQDRQDLDPAPELAVSESLRAKSERLVGLTALMIAGALFLTLAQVSRGRRAQRLYLNGGVTVLVVATVLLAVVEAM